MISIAGSIGQVAAVPEELDGANLTENAAKLVRRQPAMLETDYLESFLRTDFAQGQIAANTGQVTIGKLALFRIASLRVLVPPPDLQQRYAEMLRSIRGLRPSVAVAGGELDRLFASLQQRAFRGEL